MKRVLTALVLIPLVVYVALWGPRYAFLAVLSAVALLCYHEYTGIVSAYGIEKPGPIGYAAGLIIILTPQDPALLVTLIALIALGASLGLSDLRKGLPRAAAVLLGLVYIFGSWRSAVFLRARSPHWLLFVLALNWVGDSAAYYVGRKFGRHKLAPSVSPAKSWEGSIASMAASMLFAVIYLTRAIPTVSPLEAALLGAAGNVAGQIGDLAESALKRGAGVKDSGSMLPGHGGWLDRVDSILFALPVLHWLLAWQGV
jgi:phosphatidate cytidylyltransferase